MVAQEKAKQTGIVNPVPLEEDKKDNVIELEKRGIYRRYWNCTFGEIEKQSVPNQIRERYSEIKSYTAKLNENIHDGIGLILKGPVGTMKTSLAVAVLQQHLSLGGSGLFVPMVSLLDNIFTMKERNKEDWIRYEEKIRNTGLLVLDDLGSEYHQEWVLSKVDSIISERYNRMRPIIVTTNLSDKELTGKYAERIIDRLRSTAKVINFTGRSLRKDAV
jgi:DNA replication protein DnaC